MANVGVHWRWSGFAAPLNVYLFRRCVLHVQVICLPGRHGSRLSRDQAQAIVHAFSKRLQIQERLTHQIADAVHSGASAAGTLVLCRAKHMCMVARGVEKHASSTVTIAACGLFESNHTLRNQALQSLKHKQSFAS